MRVGRAGEGVFDMPITWDPSHSFNLIVNDVRLGKVGTEASSSFFKRLVKRANVFNDELRRGKGYAMLEAVSAAENLKSHAPTAFAHQR